VSIVVQGTLVLLAGIATMYGGPMDPNHYQDNPLYCDSGGDLLYREDSSTPWVALDHSEYESRRVWCGDELWLTFPDGQRLVARAWDAGLLYDYRVDDWPGLPIVVDVPAMFWPVAGISTPARVVNRSAAGRLLEEMAGR